MASLALSVTAVVVLYFVGWIALTFVEPLLSPSIEPLPNTSVPWPPTPTIQLAFVAADGAALRRLAPASLRLAVRAAGHLIADISDARTSVANKQLWFSAILPPAFVAAVSALIVQGVLSWEDLLAHPGLFHDLTSIERSVPAHERERWHATLVNFALLLAAERKADHEAKLRAKADRERAEKEAAEKERAAQKKERERIKQDRTARLAKHEEQRQQSKVCPKSRRAARSRALRPRCR